MKKKTRKLNLKRLADRLKEMRKEEAEALREPPKCICSMSAGCRCGRFQWDKARKKPPCERVPIIEPKEGYTYVISRPPRADWDYGGVPFRVWAQCEGKSIRTIAVEEDSKVKGNWWCWCDVSHITRQGGDEFWFPHNGLLKR